MDERKCYNCGDPSHISIRCPLQQKYTRCGICDKACFSERSHAAWCTNIEFRSTYNGEQTMIHEIDEIFSIELKPICRLAVVSPSGEKPIGRSTVWLSNSNIQIQADDGKLVFSGTKVDRRRTIIFVDEEEKRRLKIDVEKEKIFINGHYKISKSGHIAYDRYAEQNVYGRSDCTIKFTPENYMVYSKLTWYSASYFLDLYPDGALLADPYKAYLEKSLKIRVREGKMK